MVKFKLKADVHMVDTSNTESNWLLLSNCEVAGYETSELPEWFEICEILDWSYSSSIIDQLYSLGYRDGMYFVECDVTYKTWQDYWGEVDSEVIYNNLAIVEY